MFENEVAKQIAEGLLSAGATVRSINEQPPLEIRYIAPYPSLFVAEIERVFGVRLTQEDLGRTIGELASFIVPS